MNCNIEEIKIKVFSTGTAKTVFFSYDGKPYCFRIYKAVVTHQDIINQIEKIIGVKLSTDIVINEAKNNGFQADIAVSITCHEPYLIFLEKAIAAVDNQSVKAKEKFIVLDNCSEIPDFIPDDWTVFETKAGSPNPGRNLVTENAQSDWIIFADADDEMHVDYICGASYAIASATDDIAIIYADLEYSKRRAVTVPNIFSLDRLRLSNYISACSAWRKSAIIEAGNWPNTLCYDDYSLALNICNLGYRGKKNNTPILINSHDAAPRRHNAAIEGKDFPHKWEQRTFGIVSLLAGRTDCLSGWKNWLKNADLPPKTTIYVLDNSGSEVFSKKVKSFLATLDLKFMYVSYGEPCDVNKSKWERHIHVAKLYNHIIPYVNEDWLVLLEDDVVPPLDGLRKLVDAYSFRLQHGAISGIYQSRSNSKCIVGAHALDYWHDMFKPEEVADGELHEAGFIAGGFSLWNNGAVQLTKPFKFTLMNGSIPCGWDTNLSRDIRSLGKKLYLLGSVQCEHKIKSGN